MLKFLAPGEKIAAFKMDLDNFKQVNESLGHGPGDEAIRLYCSIVRKIVGRVGEVYRRGGDEIVAFASGLDAERAGETAEEVRATVEAEFQRWGGERGITSFPTASIGLVLGEGTPQFEKLVALMDDAQRRAKQGGKNRVVSLTLA